MAAGRETTFRGHAVGYMKRLPCNFDRTSEKYNVPFPILWLRGDFAASPSSSTSGEFERPPKSRLWHDERVVITPHVSAATDASEHRGVKLFCENLTRYLEGLPLENVIDWGRGY